MNDLQRAATRALPALAVLTAELGEPSPDTARALAIIEQMLNDIEAGRHPLDRPDDWPRRDHWPDRPHWDRWRWTIKTLATASGATAHCSPKYHYMRVDVGQARSDVLTAALDDIGCLIELASDGDGRTLTTVADLMDRLRALPPELPVLVEGYETGWDAIHDIRTSAVRRNVDTNDWDGEYEEQGKAEPRPGLPYQAVLIVGRRGHRREAATKREQIAPPDQLKIHITYFSLPVFDGRFVRLCDIEALPFAASWRESARGSAMLVNNSGDTLVYLHDWVAFAERFIKTGRHRWSSECRI